MPQSPEQKIAAAGFPAFLRGFSAIDAWLAGAAQDGREPEERAGRSQPGGSSEPGRRSPHGGSSEPGRAAPERSPPCRLSPSCAIRILCGADLADLARMFEDLRYPGAVFADAALDLRGKTWLFRCEDFGGAGAGSGPPAEAFAGALGRRRASFAFLEFYMDCATGRFHDPNGIIPILRGIKSAAEKGDGALCAGALGAGAGAPRAGAVLQSRDPGADPRRAIIDGAAILARYFPQAGAREAGAAAREIAARGIGSPPCAQEQRILLAELLGAPSPSPGFEFLKSSGFLGAHWPELAAMDGAEHSKEFHPEGNAWKHTMETLRYRKPAGKGSGFDLRLSLGLLLHDVGKPLSQGFGGGGAGGAGGASGGSRAGGRRGQGSRRPFDGHAQLGEGLARRFLARLGFGADLIRDVCYLVRNHMLPAALPRLPLSRSGEQMASPLFPLLMELYRCDESSSFKGLEGYYRSSAAYQSYLRHRRNPYRSPDGKKLGKP